MKRRLFALLLAAVMVLSLTAMAFGESQTVPEQSDTSAAETAVDQVQDTAAPEVTDAAADVQDGTEGETEVKDETAVTEDTEVKTEAEATAKPEATAPAAPEVSTVDGASAVPQAENQVQTAAETYVTVTLKDNTGLDLAVTQADEAQTPFKSGDKVLKKQIMGAYYLVLNVKTDRTDIGVTIEGDGDEVYHDTLQGESIIFGDEDGDGKVTITLDLLPGFQLYVKNSIAGVDCTITDPRDGDRTVADGERVHAPNVSTHEVPLNAALTDGYTFDAGPDYVQYDPSSSFNNNLTVEDIDEDQKVTLTVVKALYLHITGSDALLSVCPDPFSASNSLKEGSELTAEVPFYVTVAEGHAVTATNATAKPAEDYYYDSYEIDGLTGEITRLYEVTPNGRGDVTIQVTASQDKAPAKVEIIYEGPDEAFPSGKDELPKFTFPGAIFSVDIKAGYGLEVNGVLAPIFENEDYRAASVGVGEGIEKLTLTAVKLQDGAKLAVVGDKYELVSTFGGEAYLMDGSTIPNGSGYILVNNGTAIDEDKTTGGVCEYQDMVTVPGVTIYRLYHVQATADTVTITLKAAEPIRWVEAQLINDFEDQVELGSYMMQYDPYGGDNYWIAVDPEDEVDADVYLRSGNGAAKGFAIVLEGGKIMETVEDSADRKEYNIKVNDDANTLIVRVTLAVDLKAQAPDKPTESAPGVSDKAGTEKKLLDKATDVVEDAVKGKTPAGVTKTDAEAIADAAAAGKTITTQLVAKVVEEPSDAAAIQKAAGDAAVAQYVDAQILVTADGATIGHITQTEEPIQLAVVLSQEVLAKGHIFIVVRCHDGKTDILPATLSGNTLTFSTDKFSTFGIASTNDISHAQVSPIPDQKWTGEAITPKVTVAANGRTLTEGTDYEVRYENNTEAGAAKAIITGKAPYTGTVEESFTIVKPAPTPAPTDKPTGGSSEGGVPATGDETPLALYAGLLALGLAGLGLVLGRKKRTNK